MHEPGSREIAVVESGTVVLDIDGERHELADRRLRHLRRRPAPSLREPRPRRGGPAGRRLRRAAQELIRPCPRRCSTRSGTPTRSRREPALHRPAPRPRGHQPAGLRRPAPRRPRRPPARPHARHRRPQRARPTARRSRRASATSSAACRSQTLERNCAEFGIPIYSLGSDRQGIVHVIGPELGVTQPGMTIVCGDSHTATHGAFGALAFGIGTSEVEHVLATQCLVQRKPKSMRIRYEGDLGFGVTAKDLILGTIGQMGVDGAAGHVVEYAGPAIEALSMEGRMTVCNMTIEGGGRAGMIAPDETTFGLGRPSTARDVDPGLARAAHRATGASFDREIVVDAGALSPMVSWGTNPAQVVGGHRRGARARQRGRGARAALHGPRAGHADPGHPPRPRVHRLVHELAHRRPARRRRAWSRGARSPPTSTRWSSPARCR